MKTFQEFLEENMASQIQGAFGALGSAITSSADQKTLEYAQRILKGEDPNYVLQGIKPNGAMWSSVMKKVQELKQISK